MEAEAQDTNANEPTETPKAAEIPLLVPRRFLNDERTLHMLARPVDPPDAVVLPPLLRLRIVLLPEESDGSTLRLPVIGLRVVLPDQPQWQFPTTPATATNGTIGDIVQAVYDSATNGHTAWKGCLWISEGLDDQRWVYNFLVIAERQHAFDLNMNGYLWVFESELDNQAMDMRASTRHDAKLAFKQTRMELEKTSSSS